MSPRRYSQQLRAASAEQTRRRILDAMYTQLPRLASIDAVARDAGVARSTVYLVFGSRAGLYDALTRHVLDIGGFADLVKAVEDPDPLVHLRGGITAGVQIYAEQRDALWALRSMQRDLDGALERAELGRLEGMKHLVTRLDDAGLLRVPADTGVDTLWLLTSFDAFDVLYTGRSLSAERVAARLVSTAEHTLLRPTSSIAGDSRGLRRESP